MASPTAYLAFGVALGGGDDGFDGLVLPEGEYGMRLLPEWLHDAPAGDEAAIWDRLLPAYDVDTPDAAPV
ncbi:hypothetical protein FrEUN1fDRAFT_6818, partial [Parafrankia sp. EUN1f]